MPLEQKPVDVPERDIETAVLAVADRVPEIAPWVDAIGFTRVVQVPPLARVVDPLLQVPPLSKAKFVAFDSDNATAEDV